ncbi:MULTISPECIES: hypothetical protein [Streptomyces]|uniref:hypothetical protein n=1 Tax=Streptomyces TaxID=1883 RepID=UPI00131BD6C0|nr:hypothetical protein [Streptomyces sp. NRRL S-623]
MTWLPLLGTLVGAAIALGSSLLVERRRERKEERVERRKAKQEMYARYLAVHAEARAQLRVLSLAAELTDEERGYRAFTAYAGCFASRYELEVLAPRPVLTAARDFDRRARELRDLVIEGTHVAPRAGGHMQEYLDAMKGVHAAMRGDLGADGVE